MSLVTDSPINSSSSDNFAAFLDAELEANSAESSLDEEAEDENYKYEEAGDEEPEDEEAADDNDFNGNRIKKCKVEMLESIHERGSTSYATLEQQTEFVKAYAPPTRLPGENPRTLLSLFQFCISLEASCCCVELFSVCWLESQ